ncbi:MAG: SDR family oxidoreductase [Microthrixaceae bacterium]
MDLAINGRRAVVAASSAGLGFEAAAALVAAGARVVISGRDPERLGAAERRLSAAGGDVVAIRADVSTPDDAHAFVVAAADALGGVDVLVANAGGPPPGTFATTTLEDYRHALDLNLLSTVAMCRAAVPTMQAGGWGRVVAITSIGARQPIGSLMASTTARAGVTGFLKILATEVAPDGITVNSLQPGVHATDRLTSMPEEALEALRNDIPSGTLGDPSDFGAVVAFLCSNRARFITGTAIPVDGGANRALL